MATDYTKCSIGFASGNAFDNLANDAYIVENGHDDELSEWRKKREKHSKMMDTAINAGDIETVKFHSTRIMQCDRMIAFLERGLDKDNTLERNC